MFGMIIDHHEHIFFRSFTLMSLTQTHFILLQLCSRRNMKLKLDE